MKTYFPFLGLCLAGLVSTLGAEENSLTIHLHEDGTLAVESARGKTVAPPSPKIYYTILSEATGRALAVSMANTVRGEGVIDWTSQRSREQQWELLPAGNGTFHLVARHSGHYLAIRAGRHDEGADAIQWTPSGTAEQAWRMEREADGSFRIVASHSGKSLATTSRPYQRGASVVQESSRDDKRQKWRLQIVDLGFPEPELSVSF
jgi:hypothetical protein